MLSVSALRAGYGSLPVIDGVDLELRGGEITLLLGPNGSGKTTLLKAIAGFLRATAGRVVLEGQDVTHLGVESRARSGLRLVLEEHRVFPDLSVEENLRLCSIGRLSRRETAARLEVVTEPFPILRERFRSPARSLSGGQQQMLALAQAFVRPPRVLMCDEPSRGLALALLPDVLAFLKARAAEGTAVLIAEQMLEVALPIADHAIVLSRGTVALRGTGAEIARDDKVRRSYLGLDDEGRAGHSDTDGT